MTQGTSGADLSPAHQRYPFALGCFFPPQVAQPDFRLVLTTNWTCIGLTMLVWVFTILLTIGFSVWISNTYRLSHRFRRPRL